MNGMWGSILGLSIFGESHGKAIGVVINNLPAGLKLDLEDIQSELNRRRPSDKVHSTSRKEEDIFEIYSGVMDGYTTGMPLMALILNKDNRSADYGDLKNIFRPSHADWSAYQKYGEFYDYRGGGHFSGRLTAGIVCAGAIAKQFLKIKDINIESKIISIGKAKTEQEITEEIKIAKQNGDSLGGKVKVIVHGVKGGIGGTLFDSVEGRISQMIFSIPAIKGIEFGAGFNMAEGRGAEFNDELCVCDGKIISKTNYNGGILGGITNGMPIEFNVAIKPTPSIAQIQNTVNIDKMQNVEHKIEGRHDICIVPRVAPVLESATALVILDMILEEEGKNGFK